MKYLFYASIFILLSVQPAPSSKGQSGIAPLVFSEVQKDLPIDKAIKNNDTLRSTVEELKKKYEAQGSEVRVKYRTKIEIVRYPVYIPVRKKPDTVFIPCPDSLPSQISIQKKKRSWLWRLIN